MQADPLDQVNAAYDTCLSAPRSVIGPCSLTRCLPLFIPTDDVSTHSRSSALHLVQQWVDKGGECCTEYRAIARVINRKKTLWIATEVQSSAGRMRSFIRHSPIQTRLQGSAPTQIVVSCDRFPRPAAIGIMRADEVRGSPLVGGPPLLSN